MHQPLTLLTPPAGATLDNGTVNQTKVVVWNFAWSAVPGATHYHLHVIGPYARVPLVDIATLTTTSYAREGTGYVIERNRLRWRWKVRALVGGTWTDWSEERIFHVAPLAETPRSSRSRQTTPLPRG
jgi:hypothetical protein